MSNLDYKGLLEWTGKRDLPIQTLADILRLSGVKGASKTRLNEAFREVNHVPLADDVAAEVQKLWDLMEELVHAARPYDLSLRDAEHVHLLLGLWRRGFEFRPIVLQNND